jgi:hypothetical protein
MVAHGLNAGLEAHEFCSMWGDGLGVFNKIFRSGTPKQAVPSFGSVTQRRRGKTREKLQKNFSLDRLPLKTVQYSTFSAYPTASSWVSLSTTAAS